MGSSGAVATTSLGRTLMPDFAHSPIPTHASDDACVDLVNSAFTDYLGIDAPADRISSPEWQEWFVDRHGLGPVSGRAPLEDLYALREDLRRVLDRWSRQVRLDRRDARILDRWAS